MAIRRFKLSQDFLEQYDNKTPEWGFMDESGNSLGEITFLRSYSRVKEDGTKETWQDTCQRVIEGMFTIQREHCRVNKLPWDYKKAQRTAQDAYSRMFNFKWLPPGRGIANMGAAFVIDEWDGTPLQNPLHTDTKVYTRDGWVELGTLAGKKNIEFLSNAHKYARDVLDSKAYNAKWVKGNVSEIELQPSYEIIFQNSMGINNKIIASENHRWFVKNDKDEKLGWKRITTEELKEGDVLPITKPSKNYTPTLEDQEQGFTFRNQSKTKELVGLLNEELSKDNNNIYGFLSGYFAAGGTVDGNGRCEISSVQLEELQRISELFYDLGIVTTSPSLSRNSNNDDGLELWKIEINKWDLDENFFMKEIHKTRWIENTVGRGEEISQETTVKSITPVGEKPVLCATIPEYEQFVIDGFILTSNCAFVSTKTDFSDAMHFLMLSSMNGVGVGLDVLGANRHLVRGVTKDSTTFVIPDTREGWAEALKILLDAHIEGTERPVFDYSQIRPAGAPIARFGGTASGPESLQELLEWIDNLLTERVNEHLTSSDIADIANKIGTCVISGSSRRSAELILGPQTDEYMDLKNYGQMVQKGVNKEIFVISKDENGNDVKLHVNEFFNLHPKNELSELIRNICKNKIVNELPELMRNSYKNKIVNENLDFDIFDIDKIDIDDQLTIEEKFEKILTHFENHEIIFQIRLEVAKELAGESSVIVEDEPNMVWEDGPAAYRTAWGWMSNNSILAEVGQDYTEVAKRTVINGEPGYVWMEPTRGFGRMKDRRDNKDWRAAGYNPCAEQPLESYEMCTLVETFPTRAESIDDYLKTLKVAYLYGKTVTLLPTVFERTNAVMARNRRIGLSQTGITTYIEQHGIAKWRELCDEGYKYIQGKHNGGPHSPGLDDIYSEWLCIRPSIRTTTVKPSGTVSILTGDSPGVHWNPASGYYIRRITMSDGPLLDALFMAGYPIEESVYSKNQWVVSFPVKSPFQRSEKDVTIWEKVALAAEAQHWWSDNSVSVTVSYDPETEGQHIAPILSIYEGRLKTVSFLPMSKDVYKQMPYEEITEERYNEICRNIKPVDRNSLYTNGEEALGEKFCNTTACEITEFENNKEAAESKI